MARTTTKTRKPATKKAPAKAAKRSTAKAKQKPLDPISLQ